MDLFLEKEGLSLRVRQGAFEIQHSDGKHRFAPQNIECISLGHAIKISSAAILLAIEFKIPLIILDKHGHPQGQVWSHRYGSVARLRKRQLAFVQGPEGANWVRHSICQRIRMAMQLLQQFGPTKNIDPMKDALNKLMESPNQALTEDQKASWRGWEGTAMRCYFQQLSQILPSQWQFKGRSRRPAQDGFNCLLNYGNGMFYSLLERGLIQTGLDPYVGIFHRDDLNRPVLAFDLMEQFRHWVEKCVIDWCCQDRSGLEIFTIKSNAFWLNQQGKKQFIPFLKSFLEEQVIQNEAGWKVSRKEGIRIACRALKKEIWALEQKE